VTPYDLFLQSAAPLLPSWTAVPVGLFAGGVAVMLVREWVRKDRGYETVVRVLREEIDRAQARVAERDAEIARLRDVLGRAGLDRRNPASPPYEGPEKRRPTE
jgi:hypothetical protein